MKRNLSLLVLLLSMAGLAAGQAKTIAPDVVVKNLYAAHDAKRGPFFQKKSRARVDLYFTKSLADLIWRDAVDTREGVGALDFDPLYNAQDIKITKLKIAKPMYGEGNLNVADVEVTFKNYKTDETVLFRLERGKSKKWLISNISWPSTGYSLTEIYADNTDPQLASIDGQLHMGKTESHILYVGRESGDFAAYCFKNDSEVGRAILAKCKDGDQCQVRGEMDAGDCKPEGIEADLSASGKILSVKAVRSLGKQK